MTRLFRLYKRLSQRILPPHGVPTEDTVIPPYPPVEITWVDAQSASSQWTEVVDLDLAPRHIVSVGMLLPDALEGHHVIVQSVDDTRVDGALAIPDAMIVSTRILAGTY